MSRWTCSLACLAVLTFARGAAAQPGGDDSPPPEPPPLPEAQPADEPPPPPPPSDPGQPPPGYGQPAPGYGPPQPPPGYAQPGYGYPGYAPPPPPPPAPPKRINRTVHRHDTFYLRLSLGVALGTVTSSGKESGVDLEATFEGAGPSYELLLGGTPGGGFVLGGGILAQDIQDPNVTIDLGGQASESEIIQDESLGIVVLGPFFDWFPDPEAGGHVGAMIGFSGIGLEGDDGEMSSGVGAALFGGYDFWVGEQWSIGPEARVMIVSGHRDILGTQFDESAAGFALNFTALYH